MNPPAPNNGIETILNIQGLVNQLGNWLLVLIPIVGGAMMAYHFMMKSAAQDEQAAAQHSRSIRTIAISAGLGIAALSLVKWITAWALKTDF